VSLPDINSKGRNNLRPGTVNTDNQTRVNNIKTRFNFEEMDMIAALDNASPGDSDVISK